MNNKIMGENKKRFAQEKNYSNKFHVQRASMGRQDRRGKAYQRGIARGNN